MIFSKNIDLNGFITPPEKINMPEYETTFTEILSAIPDPPDPSEFYDIAEDIAQALYERFESLPPIREWEVPVRNFFALYDLNFQVGNGGFAQAAYNIPELLPVAEQAFSEIGCSEAAKLCRTAIEMLPKEFSEYLAKGIDDTNSISEVFSHFKESDMAGLDSAIPDEFWVEERLSHYVLDHRQSFLALDTPT